ncbi:MAG: hypothetical protein WBD87_05265 [Candidatus Acidiferrales bacterium]
MAVLEKIGLVCFDETEVSYTPILSDRPLKTEVVRYQLTEEGKQFYREQEQLGLVNPNGSLGDFVLRQQALDKIVKWEGPMELGDYKEVTVFYTYKIEHLASWMMNPDVQRAFPGAVLAIDGAGKMMLDDVLVLTSEGWESKDLR